MLWLWYRATQVLYKHVKKNSTKKTSSESSYKASLFQVGHKVVLTQVQVVRCTYEIKLFGCVLCVRVSRLVRRTGVGAQRYICKCPRHNVM
jgi:hypothetical protein